MSKDRAELLALAADLEERVPALGERLERGEPVQAELAEVLGELQAVRDRLARGSWYAWE